MSEDWNATWSTRLLEETARAGGTCSVAHLMMAAHGGHVSAVLIIQQFVESRQAFVPMYT